MGIDYSTSILLPNFDFWARNVTITPVKSQPGQPAYSNRGYYDAYPTEVMADDGTVITDWRTILDIREIEYGVVPVQGDHVNIPADTGAMGPVGNFEVTNAFTQGGGMTTLELRFLGSPKP